MKKEKGGISFLFFFVLLREMIDRPMKAASLVSWRDLRSGVRPRLMSCLASIKTEPFLLPVVLGREEREERNIGKKRGRKEGGEGEKTSSSFPRFWLTFELHYCPEIAEHLRRYLIIGCVLDW